MRTIFSAKFGENEHGTRYFHVPIVGFYLASAREYAKSCQSMEPGDDLVRTAICAVTFSAMAIEAHINDASDWLLSGDAYEAFDKVRLPYKKPKGMSSVEFKYVTLIREHKKSEVPEDILAGIRGLVDTRNTLVHYKPQDTAGKYIIKSSKIPKEGGGAMISFSFMEPPVRVEPPFIQRLSKEEAVRSYNAARGALKYWCDLDGAKWNEEEFPVIA